MNKLINEIKNNNLLIKTNKKKSLGGINLVIEMKDLRYKQLSKETGTSEEDLKIRISMKAILKKLEINIDTINGFDKTIKIFQFNKKKLEQLLVTLIYKFNLIDTLTKEDIKHFHNFNKFETLNDVFDFIKGKLQPELQLV